MINLGNIGKQLASVVKTNSPTILSAMAVVGVVTTTALAIKATPKALRIIDNEINLRENAWQENSEEVQVITIFDMIKLCWQPYIPAAATGIVTIACILGANSINVRRNAAIMSAYSLTEAAFKEYQGKVVESIGKNKETKVRDDIAQDRVSNDPLSNKELIITGNGEVLCYDTFTGRYFNSDMETIRKAQNDINAQCINDMYASLNDYYGKLSIPRIKTGDDLGWNTNTMLDLQFSAVISEDGKPCISVTFYENPVGNFAKLW